MSWSEHVANVCKSSASKPRLLRRTWFLPQMQLLDFHMKVILPSVTYGLVVWGLCNETHSSATWKVTRKSQRHCVWTSMEHQCRRRYSANTMHSFEALFKVQLTEFVFKCNKGYTVPQCKDVFVQRNSSRKNRRNDDTILPRTKRNFIRNSKQYKGAIAWNSLSSKESTAKNLKELKLLLTKFDIGKIDSGFVVIFCKLCKCSLIS